MTRDAAAEAEGPGARLHHTTPDLGLSSETQSDDGIAVDDLPQQVSRVACDVLSRDACEL